MDALIDQAIVLAATLGFSLSEAADVIAEVNRDPRPPVTIGNVTFVDFRALRFVNHDHGQLA